MFSTCYCAVALSEECVFEVFEFLVGDFFGVGVCDDDWFFCAEEKAEGMEGAASDEEVRVDVVDEVVSCGEITS